VQSCEVVPPATPTGSKGSSEEEEKLKQRVKLLEQQEQVRWAAKCTFGAAGALLLA
jgi:hypothetical protein